MKKINELKGMYALLIAVAAMVGITIYASCSAEEDYDGYSSRDELFTLATSEMYLRSEGLNVDTSGYTTDSMNCGGVALAILHTENFNSNCGCSDIQTAYSHVKRLAGGSCTFMQPSTFISVSSVLGLGFSTDIYTGYDDATVQRYLKSMLKASFDFHKIVYVINLGTKTHYVIGDGLNYSIKNGDTIINNIPARDGSTVYSLTCNRIKIIIK